MSGDLLLEVKGLGKRFGGLQAVADVDLEVRTGEILGVIGPNGAGKSTTFSMIAGALPPPLAACTLMASLCWACRHMPWQRVALCGPSSITSPLPACLCVRM